MPLHTILTRKIPEPLSVIHLIAHPGSTSKMLDNVISSTDTLLSHRSLSTRKSVPTALIASPCFPQPGFKLGLVMRFTMLSQTSWTITAHAVTIPAVRDEVVHLHAWHVNELQHMRSCPDTQRVHQLQNGSCVALCSSRSAADGCPGELSSLATKILPASAVRERSPAAWSSSSPQHPCFPA